MPNSDNVIHLAPRPSELQAVIRSLALDSKNVRWLAQEYTTHAEGRLDLRDITDAMMFEVLRSGYLKGAIEPGRKAGEWKCKMCKKFRGLRDVGVVTIVIDNRRLFIKTVEWEDPR